MRAALTLSLIGFVALGVIALIEPSAALRGWLIGFVCLGAIALGCAAWLAIHSLTGGRWGICARPALLRGAAALPIVILLLAPLLLAAPAVYPWASAPDTAGSGVAGHYLDAPLLALRSLVLLGGLWLFARAARQEAGMPRIAAGLCLLLYAVGMDLSAFDWVLSLDPRFTSSAFGMQIIVEQLMAALAFVILTTPAAPDDKVWGDLVFWGDLGSLLLACLLGEGYLLLMSLTIDWYGDLPNQAEWYLRRSGAGWGLVEALFALVGLAGPIVALLFERVRRHPGPLRLVAGAALLGGLVETIWLIAPGFGQPIWSALAGVAAILAGGGLMLALTKTPPREPEPLRRFADGA